MPLTWGWVENATYSQSTFNGKVYDTWSLGLGYAMNILLLDSAGKPAYYIRAGCVTVQIQFHTWSEEITDPAVFHVPSDCPSVSSGIPSNVDCVSRTTMTDRAKAWLAAHVPYNQEQLYQGYREDCSGYVSFCWETSKPGYTTFTMPQISHEISKDELQPGDVLLCTTEHVVLFGGWDDASHTQYFAYEETRPGEGTVGRVTPYPYWYNTGCFVPYRYNLVC
jgi:hypothetical protein